MQPVSSGVRSMYKLNTLQKQFLNACYSVSRYPPDPLMFFFPPQEIHQALGALKMIHHSFSPTRKGKQHKSRVKNTCQEGIQLLEVLPEVRTFTPVRVLIHWGGRRWIRTQLNNHSFAEPSISWEKAFLTQHNIGTNTEVRDFQTFLRIKYLLYLWTKARTRTQESYSFSQDSESRTEEALKWMSHWKLKETLRSVMGVILMVGRVCALVQWCS